MLSQCQPYQRPSLRPAMAVAGIRRDFHSENLTRYSCASCKEQQYLHWNCMCRQFLCLDVAFDSTVRLLSSMGIASDRTKDRPSADRVRLAHIESVDCADPVMEHFSGSNTKLERCSALPNELQSLLYECSEWSSQRLRKAARD